MKRKILICGDSFAADWTVKYPGSGWPNMLANHYNITNIAQAGCSEYKILQQLKSVELLEFDFIIVSHTSPYRLYVKEHPVHFNDKLHSNSDLIYSDIYEHARKNPKLSSIIDYFENYVDLDYLTFVHSLICKEIDQLLVSTPVPHLNVTIFDWDSLYRFENIIDFNEIFIDNPGIINHLSAIGNEIVFEHIKEYVDRQIT